MYLERQDLISCFEAREFGWIIQSRFAKPYHYLEGILISFVSLLGPVLENRFFIAVNSKKLEKHDQASNKQILLYFLNFSSIQDISTFLESQIQYACITNVSYRFQSLLPATLKPLLSEKSGISFKLNRANVSTLYCHDVSRDRKKGECKWIFDPYQCTKIERQLLNFSCQLILDFVWVLLIFTVPRGAVINVGALSNRTPGITKVVNNTRKTEHSLAQRVYQKAKL